jgi:hypothetical protein
MHVEDLPFADLQTGDAVGREFPGVDPHTPGRGLAVDHGAVGAAEMLICAQLARPEEDLVAGKAGGIGHQQRVFAFIPGGEGGERGALYLFSQLAGSLRTAPENRCRQG